MDLHPGEDGVDPISDHPSSSMDDFESVFESFSSKVPSGKTVIFQGTH